MFGRRVADIENRSACPGARMTSTLAFADEVRSTLAQSNPPLACQHTLAPAGLEARLKSQPSRWAGRGLAELDRHVGPARGIDATPPDEGVPGHAGDQSQRPGRG